MDCSQAQAFFKLSTLDHDAIPDRDALAVKRHLADCESCCRAFESERRFDHEISRVMSDVPPPAGMKDRLRELISTADQPTVHVRAPRRLARRVALGAVGLMVLMAAWFATRVPPLTEMDVRHLAELDLDALPAASSDAVFPLPVGWERVRGVRFGDMPRLASIGSRPVPMMPVLVSLRSRTSPATGFLIRLSEFKSQRPIEAASFSSAMTQYASFGSWVVWREGGAVYVCVIRDTHAMERLREAIANSRELT